ncbi:DUF4129 domain-containing protein [Paraliobacillus sp. X-1268]|uniref:DUF4129 domain-containing protein n=1 Tax=Paraliobacillus sp. X-1268 TaxID=2213193 RepID=UPI000E3DC48B|nr:DUF4129 domain-containing protein [Paraliobacillus sp. X-1268]
MTNVKQAKDSIEEILSQQEYQVYYEDNRNFIQVLWDEIKDWIEELLSNWFSTLQPTSSIGDALIILALLVVVILVLLVIFLLSRNWVRKKRLNYRQPLHQLNEKNWLSHDHLKEANRLEQKKVYSEATRHLFLTFLLVLHEKEWLQARMWKTNWEYHDELRLIKSDLADDFYQLALFFEEVTYGEYNIEEKDYQIYREQIEKWLAELKSINSSIEREEG